MATLLNSVILASSVILAFAMHGSIYIYKIYICIYIYIYIKYIYIYDKQIVHHNPCFNLFILHNN